MKWVAVVAAVSLAAQAQAQTTQCRPTTVGMPSAGVTCETDTAESAASNGAGTAVAAGAVIGLGVLIGRAIHASHERKEQELRLDRAKRVAALAEAHDCTGAQNIAFAEHDPEMARAVEGMCKTAVQAGEQPAFAPSAGHVAWAKAYLRYDPASVLSANDGVLVLRTDRPPINGQLWVHEEALSLEGAAGMKGRSQVMLAAFDCEAGTFAIRASTVYAGNNLTGEAASNDGSSGMVAVRPGSLADAESKVACQVRTAATR